MTTFSTKILQMKAGPEPLLPWLTHQESLTDKLRQVAGEAELTIINQNWIPASWWDSFVLSINENLLFQREIIMATGQGPCWYARSVIPESTYLANEAIFNRLNQESLGDIIFNDARIQRVSMIHYAIDAECIEYYWLNENLRGDAIQFWVRLSAFTLNNFSFFLIEILLPGLTKFCEKNSA